MKKVISIILAISIMLVSAIPAFAGSKAHDPDECENVPVIVVRGMDFAGLYVDYGTENEKPILDVDVPQLLLKLAGVFANLSFFRTDEAIDIVINYAYNLLKYLTIDENGDSLYNIGQPKYTEGAGNYQELVEGEFNELGMARACIENFGGDHTYYLNYDWRLDPFVVADEINTLVETAVKETGHKKVSIVCASMGGIMTLAYLTKYGYDKIERCLFMSSTLFGAQVASDLLNGRVSIEADNLYNFLNYQIKNKDKPFVEELCGFLNDIGGFDFLTEITDFILEYYYDDIYDRILKPIFGHMLSLWGLVQPEDYESAINFMLGGRNAENADFLKRADRLQAMMAGRDKLLNKMINSGVKIAIVSNYNSPLTPFNESADWNGDGTLETVNTSGYATVAKYGETLGDDYVAKNPKYLSPDRIVDLSTAHFPKYTYAIKDAPHVSCRYGSDYSDFMIWLLTYDGEFYAGASSKYPQFMVSGYDQNFRTAK